MARTDTLGHFLTDVASAIKTKKGDETPILASDFDTEIENLPSGGSSHDWSAIGYNGEPSSIKDDYDYAVEIKNNWQNVANLKEKYRNNTELTYMPQVDMSNATTTNQMFAYCSGLKEVGSIINLPNCTNVEQMFSSCTILNKLGSINIPNAISTKSMFTGCYGLKSIDSITTSTKLTNCGSMFNGCRKLTTIPTFDTSNVTDFSSMFSSCYELTTMPTIDTSKGTSFNNMFSSCSSLTNFSTLNTSNGTNFSSMFYSFGSNLDNPTIPLIDTSKGTNFNSMFMESRKLKTIPLLDFSSGTSFKQMFTNCLKLEEIPAIDTSSGTNFSQMFDSCYVLHTIPQLDFGNATNISSVLGSIRGLINFGGFKDLGKAYPTNISANNYQYSLVISQNETLTHDSLMNIINNLYDIASKGVATQYVSVGATNFAKLTQAEIDIATAKGWTVRA